MYAQREELFERLMAELDTLRRTGQQYAENEADYRKALRIAILEKKQLRDCAEALYKASSEAIMALKLRIKTVDADIQRTWTSGGEETYR